jgi:hypothetical protein
MQFLAWFFSGFCTLNSIVILDILRELDPRCRRGAKEEVLVIASRKLECGSYKYSYREVPNLRSYHNLRVGGGFPKNREFLAVQRQILTPKLRKGGSFS